MQFWQPYCFFCQKSANCSLSIRKSLKNKIVFSNSPARESSTEWRKGFAQSARMLKSIWFFSKKVSHNDIMDTSKAVFTTLPKKNSPEGRKFLAHFWKKITHTHSFFSKIFSFQDFLWKRTFQFWQTCWKSFDKKLKQFAQRTKNMKNIHFIFKKKHLWNDPRDMYNTVSTTGKFLLIVQKWQKAFFPTNFSLNKSIETWNAVLSHLHKKSCRKAEVFSGQVPKKYRKHK